MLGWRLPSADVDACAKGTRAWILHRPGAGSPAWHFPVHIKGADAPNGRATPTWAGCGEARALPHAAVDGLTARACGMSGAMADGWNGGEAREGRSIHMRARRQRRRGPRPSWLNMDWSFWPEQHACSSLCYSKLNIQCSLCKEI